MASGVQTDPPSLRSGETSLTARVRALYEGSAVPVREIAALAGVTERTIYSYAAKHAWKPRYAWLPDGARPRAWRAQARFAPTKGAGGRFIRRADQGKPFAVGLKATDAPGAARAAADCTRAQAIAAEAEYEARLTQLEKQKQDSVKELAEAFAELRRYEIEQAMPPRRRPPVNNTLVRCLHLRVDLAIDRWWKSGEAFLAAMQERPKAAAR